MPRRDGASKTVNISRKNSARSSLIRPTTLRRARESETVISRKISARSSLIRPTIFHRVSESNTIKSNTINLSRTISAPFSPIRPGWASGSKTFKISRKLSARSSLITPTMLRRTGESKILILSQATCARPSFITSTLLHRASELKEIDVVQASSARSSLITPTMFGQDSRSEIVRYVSQTISGGEGGRGGVGAAQGSGGNGGNGEGPTLSYYINPAEGFHMPVHIVMPANDLHAGPPAGTTSEGSPLNVSILSPSGSLKSAPCTPQFNIYVTEKRRREETREDDPSSAHTTEKRRRLEEDDRIEDDAIEIIRGKDLSLIHEISRGPGYLLHAGQNKDRAVIVKVFNKSPTVRQQLELTVNLSKELMHSNVLRIKGISALQSDNHFIVYDNDHCVNAEVLLAEALKNDLGRSVTLGFKMIAGVSAGISHLCMQGVWSRSMGVTNFHILVDPEDRFSIIINAPHSQEVETAALQESDDNALIVFNALLDKTLISANRLLHKEQIKRDPAIPDANHTSTVSVNLAATSASSSQNSRGEDLSVPPRREYVWRNMDNEWEALVEVSERLTVDLKLHLSRLSRFTRIDGSSAHRCPGYVREEITLATTILESAVVVHDTPTPLEECPVCHEVVGLNEAFLCICGDLTPGSQHTIKCRECKLWSHSDCVGNQKDFICRLCLDSVVTPVPSITYGMVRGPGGSERGPILNHDISGQHFTGINSVHNHRPRGSDRLPFLQHETDSTRSSSESPPTPTLSLSPSESPRPLYYESAIRDQRGWMGVTYSHSLHNPHMRGVSPFEGSSHSSHPDMYQTSYNSSPSLPCKNLYPYQMS